MTNSSSGVKGTVNLVLRGPDGKVKQHKTIRNKLMRQGLAHIVGRMLDPMQNGQAKVLNTDFTAVTNPVSSDYQHDIPKMMRFMGLGIGTRANVGAIGTPAVPATASPTQKITMTDIGNANPEGIEYRLQQEVTVGTKTPTGGTASPAGSNRMLQGLTAVQVEQRKQGTITTQDDNRCDMGNSTLPTLIDGTNNTEVSALIAACGGSGTDLTAASLIAATPATGVGFHPDQMVRKIDPTNLFQGIESGQIVNSETTATQNSESTGSPVDRGNAVAVADIPTNGATETGHLSFDPSDGSVWSSGTTPTFPGKRLGMKLRYIALFPPFCPSTSNLAITEAGIFNSVNGHHSGGSRTDKNQTMLCRTTFLPVNKNAADSLQITWTIDFKDATN